jgi:CO dehydrogenase/acetyl-CoA synthase alpha subunit
MDKDKIIDHLMGENQFYRYKIKKYEKEVNKLKNQIQAARGKSRSKRVRKEALRRDNYECIECGKNENLNVHHVIPISEGGEDSLNNVITLCIDCHIEAHEGESSSAFLIGLKRRL